MRRQILAVAFLILVSAGAAFSQTVEQQAAKIRRIYAETNKRIEDGAKDNTLGLHYAAWTVGGERDGQQWRAVGAMKTTDEFWFDGEPGFDEGQIADARKTIRRIVSTDSAAGKIQTCVEYLFDSAGELVFVYLIEYAAGEDGGNVERRFYFSRNKLIRVAANGKNTDAKFAAEDAERAKSESETARKLQDRFALMFAG